MKRFLAAAYIIIAVTFTGYAQPPQTGGNTGEQYPAMVKETELPLSRKGKTLTGWKEAMARYDYKQAISLLEIEADSLRKNLELQTDSAAAELECRKLKEVLVQKATCQKNIYRFLDAIESLDEALQIGGEDAVTYANIAECHRLSGNDIAAYMFYENAVMMDPGNLFLRIQKMMLEYKMEEHGKCIADGRDILQKDTIPSILITMGNSFNKMNLSDSALVYYSKAYAMNRYDFRTLEKISNIYLGREMLDTVLVMANKYLELDSTNYVIAPIKGLAQYGLKDYKGAYDTFKKSLEYGCDELSGYYYLGLCRLMEKDYRSARGWFSKAAKLDSTDVNLVYYQGVCYLNYPGDYTRQAKQYFDKAEAMLQPDSTMMFKLHSSRAEMYLKTEEYSNAAKYFNAAQRYGTLQPVQIMQIGYTYRLQKDYPNALKWYDEYFKVGKKGSSIWKFVEAEVEFIKEEQFMQEGKEPEK